MADEQALLTMKEGLNAFDTTHLQKLIVVAYDRWNWDTGTQADKDWFDVAEEILAERGVIVTNPTGSNTNIVFSMGASGPTVPVLTMDSVGDLILGTKKTLKLKNSDSLGAMEHEILEADQNGNLAIGFDLKYAILNFIATELDCGTLSANNGRQLKQMIEDKALEAIRNRI